MGQKAITFVGPFLWNSLPELIKKIDNLNTLKTLWRLFMDGVQLPQGSFEEAVYFLSLSSQIFLVLILSTSEG